ncbi:MAG: hypothetical protein ACLT9V_03280 [Anaerococcus obesiensis]
MRNTDLKSVKVVMAKMVAITYAWLKVVKLLGKEMIDIIDWSDSDPDHKRPNCRYSDTRTALDIVTSLAINGIMTEYPIIEWEKKI